jgi:ABC-type molybdate transport system substrate-binding protein
VSVIKLPAWAQPKITYAMAVVAGTANRSAAQAFVKKVLGKAGQAQLRKYGFLPLVKPAEKRPPRIKPPLKKR